MKIYSGRYSWDGKRHTAEEPIAWFPGAYDLKIFDLTAGGVHHLKPYLCIYAKTGDGVSISENPEKFAKHVCADFSLDVEKVLWAEKLTDGDGGFEVVVFTRSGRLGENYFYRISKRKPLAGEQKLIEKELATG